MEISNQPERDQPSGLGSRFDKPKGPIRLSKAELTILQMLKPSDNTKWNGVPLLEANGITVGSGIILVEIDGQRYRMNTAPEEFGRILGEV